MAKYTFEQWKQQIDQRLVQQIGMDSDMLPDMPWRDWFLDNMSDRGC